MKRTIIKIDESLCNGCGACVKGCHEGALQMIDGKARIISDLFCDGLGACIGECPVGAIELEEREAEPYDECAVMERIAAKGEKTIIAHLMHLKEHNETEYYNQGLAYLAEKGIAFAMPQKQACGCPGGREMSFTPAAMAGDGCPGGRERSFAPAAKVGNGGAASADFSGATAENSGAGPSTMAKGGCPGWREISFAPAAMAGSASGFGADAAAANAGTAGLKPLSQLRQWPVQLHLLNPEAAYFRGADVVLAADCAAYAYADFHNRFIDGKTIAIACPKLDTGKESYIEKLTAMIDRSAINTLTVVTMEVPCCGGLLALARTAASRAVRKIPMKQVVIGIQGDILKDEWV